ncbi:MAG: sodium:solute symporter family protein [Candidatus Marinamargulisbacteria bacterium]
MIGIGVLSSKKVSTMVDYLVAGRKISPYLGVASLGGTELGLITVMYNAQKGFSAGLSALHMAIIAGVVTFLVGKSGFIVVPLRRLKVLTIPEFYEQRFGRSVRVVGAIVLVLAGVLNMGLFLKVAAIFVAVVFGLDPTGWPLIICMTTLLVLVLVYTLLGGMVSVILTDFIQFILLSLALIIFAGVLYLGLGWDAIVTGWQAVHGAVGFNPFHEASGFGVAYVVWMLITAGLVSIAIWPTALSRALVLPDDAAVKKQYMLASIPMMARFVIPMVIGAMAFILLGPGDGLVALPTAALQVLPAGVLGLLVAGLLAAMMSTFDGYLLCWSSVIVRDIIMPLSNRTWRDSEQLRWIRYFIVLCGLFMLYWGLFYQGSEDVWDYLAITGAIYFTGAIPVMIGGLYWHRASNVGALLSLLCGCCALFGLAPVQQALEIPLSSAAIGLVTVIFASVVFVIGSLIWPSKEY